VARFPSGLPYPPPPDPTFGPTGMPFTLDHHTWLNAIPAPLFVYLGQDATATEWPARVGGETLSIQGGGPNPLINQPTIYTDGTEAVIQTSASIRSYVGANAAPFQYGPSDDVILAVVLYPAVGGADRLLHCEAGTGVAVPGWRVFRQSAGQYRLILKDGTGNAFTGITPFFDAPGAPHVLTWVMRKARTGYSFADAALFAAVGLTSMTGTGIPTVPLTLIGGRGGIAFAAMWTGVGVISTTDASLANVQASATAQQIARDIYRSFSDARYMIPVVP